MESHLWVRPVVRIPVPRLRLSILFRRDAHATCSVSDRLLKLSPKTALCDRVSQPRTRSGQLESSDLVFQGGFWFRTTQGKRAGAMADFAHRRRPPLLLSISLLVILLLPSLPAASGVEKALPFIVLHGIGDECKNEGLYEFTEYLISASGAVGFCIEIGNGASDSFFMRLDKQADIVCQQVKKIPELKDGYNVVGLSQGNVVARAVIEFCDGPPVNNFVSLGGPHAGTASVPGCAIMTVCKLFDSLIRIGVYSPFVQNHLAPSGYVKIPNDLPAYYKGSLFLPKLNNEIASTRNEIYKKRLESLNHLVLIMFQQDAILIPPETAWFGYYADNDFSTVLPPNETDLYKEDWIGLRALDEGGRVSYIAFPGDHLRINDTELDEFVVPYLTKSFPSTLSLYE